MSTMDKFRAAKEEMKKAREKAAAIAQDAFKEQCALLFEEMPDLKSFSWSQYTPYFNDGDECVFSAHIDYPDINGEEYCEEKYCKTEEAKAIAKMGDKVVDFLRNFGDEDYKDVFGDHVKVTVTREGMTVEGYEHD